MEAVEDALPNFMSSYAYGLIGLHIFLTQASLPLTNANYFWGETRGSFCILKNVNLPLDSQIFYCATFNLKQVNHTV